MVHAQRVGCIAVFVVLDFDLGVEEKATAGSQSDVHKVNSLLREVYL